MADAVDWSNHPAGMTYALFPMIMRDGVQQVPPLGDPDAPECARPASAAADWPTEVAPGRSARVREVSLRIPLEFVQVGGDLPDDGVGGAWGHALGFWSTPDETGRDARRISLWIGPTEGYPTIGMPVGTEQLWFDECRRSRGGPSMRIAWFVLREPAGALEHLVAAYWRVGEDAWLTGLASGSTPRIFDEARPAFESLTFRRGL